MAALGKVIRFHGKRHLKCGFLCVFFLLFFYGVGCVKSVLCIMLNNIHIRVGHILQNCPAGWSGDFGGLGSVAYGPDV